MHAMLRLTVMMLQMHEAARRLDQPFEVIRVL